MLMSGCRFMRRLRWCFRLSLRLRLRRLGKIGLVIDALNASNVHRAKCPPLGPALRKQYYQVNTLPATLSSLVGIVHCSAYWTAE